MTKEVLVKNKFNIPIGSCKDMGDRILATHFKTGYVGYYNKSSDITFDKSGKIYCWGDGTQSLIRDADNA